jgi:cell division protein FtsQ
VSLLIARIRQWFEFGRPMLWLTGFLLACVFLTGIFAGGHVRRAADSVGHSVDVVVADAGFGISSVRMVGNRRTQPDDILKALGVQSGESIFAADVRDARKRLMALPWVFDAEVRRQFPDSISVSLVERVPFALWQQDNGLLYVVERSGRTITVAQRSQFPHLPSSRAKARRRLRRTSSTRSRSIAPSARGSSRCSAWRPGDGI